MRAGDSYLKRPCLGRSVVYLLHSITSHECLSTQLADLVGWPQRFVITKLVDALHSTRLQRSITLPQQRGFLATVGRVSSQTPH